jgi:hypothetical protein
MNLDDAQRRKVSAWVQEGLKLSEIQNRLASELGIRMTYRDVRFLVDDLKLVPKDVEPASAPVADLKTPETPRSKTPPAPDRGAAQPNSTAAGNDNVSVTIDQLARPGAVVSGKVTFSDGNIAEWYLDQTGRLGLVPQQPGYRPAPADVQRFQMLLQSQLSQMGF